jgi:hypothetical protein
MRALIATLVPLSLFALGCGEDLGTCDDPNEGRDTVIVNGVVMYGGQAIINKSCAGGRCHSSTADGVSRSGAPKGLDFDLMPVRESDAMGEALNKADEPVIELKPSQISGLRVRQRTVYDLRQRIWDQIRWGLMPPRASEFSLFLELKSIFNTDEETACEKEKRYSSLQSARGQEVLRNWLACRAPIVETNTAVVTKETGGAIGWQFPICEAPVSEGDSISLEALLEGPLASCQSCHPTLSDPDFSSLELTASSVVDETRKICEGKPYVTKGDPEKSFLYDMISKDDPGCGHSRMPQGGALKDEEIALVESWIKAGAPITNEEAASSASSSSTDEADE